MADEHRKFKRLEKKINRALLKLCSENYIKMLSSSLPARLELDPCSLIILYPQNAKWIKFIPAGQMSSQRWENPQKGEGTICKGCRSIIYKNISCPVLRYYYDILSNFSAALRAHVQEPLPYKSYLKPFFTEQIIQLLNFLMH